MARTGRPGLSAKEKDELWARWRDGQSLSDIGRALGKHAGSVFGVLAASGGMTPATRKLRAGALTLVEREEISRGLAKELPLRSIARRLGKSPSTITREVARNGGARKYRAAQANERALQKARRPKKPALLLKPRLRSVVASRLLDDWSPEQIAGWLAAKYPENRDMRVSHETIYRSLYLQTRNVLHRQLLDRLRTKRRMRRGKRWSTTGQLRGRITDAVSIHDRPAEVAARAKPEFVNRDQRQGRGAQKES